MIKFIRSMKQRDREHNIGERGQIIIQIEIIITNDETNERTKNGQERREKRREEKRREKSE